jgi:SHS2 domain-containing protein
MYFPIIKYKGLKCKAYEAKSNYFNGQVILPLQEKTLMVICYLSYKAPEAFLSRQGQPFVGRFLALAPLNFYSLEEHTADLCLKVTGKSLEALFENAALALVDLIIPVEALSPSQTVDVTASGEDVTDVMVNFLREILYLVNGKGLAPCQVKIERLLPAEIAANAGVDETGLAARGMIQEIKAVTYHEASVEKKNGIWQAKFIMDV